MPSIIAALGLTDTQAGSLSTLFILSYALVSPVAGWLGRSAPTLPARGRRRPRLERGDLRLGPGADLRGAGVRARAHRRRRGELHGRHAVAALRLLSAGAARPGACALFYAAIPVGSALGYVLGGVIERPLRMAVAPSSSPACPARRWRSRCCSCGIPRAARRTASAACDAIRRPGLRRRPRRSLAVAVALARTRSFVFNTAAQVIYTFVVGGAGDLDADLLRSGCATCRWPRPISASAACWRWPASWVR